MIGKRTFEVQPLAISNKETNVKVLSQHPDVDFIACACDDNTDEDKDMFGALYANSIGDSCYAITVDHSKNKALAKLVS